jgi:hypothetical protein
MHSALAPRADNLRVVIEDKQAFGQQPLATDIMAKDYLLKRKHLLISRGGYQWP